MAIRIVFKSCLFAALLLSSMKFNQAMAQSADNTTPPDNLHVFNPLTDCNDVGPFHTCMIKLPNGDVARFAMKSDEVKAIADAQKAKGQSN